MCEGKCECVYVSVWISFINFLVSGHPCGADTAVGLEREQICNEHFVNIWKIVNTKFCHIFVETKEFFRENFDGNT